eukprot:superscaffoldBa00002723_g15106
MALNGKIAVVTGGALGIGKAMTEILVRNGAKVALLDVNETAGKSLMEDLNKQHGQERALFLSCNVESEEQIKAAFQKVTETFGGIDIICNNAGILNENEWEKTVAINLLKGGRGGVIVNTASIAGLGPLLSCPVYTATKHGVVGFTRAMAMASTVSGYGIRFNALCPGFVQTDLFTAISSNLGRYSNLADATKQLVDKTGILIASTVAECLLELVTDETKNGDALMLLPKGKSYVTFPTFIL